MRWLAGGIGYDQTVTPLLSSDDDDLLPYVELEFDEQASFLRHRMCGILQRASDRLWAQQKKADHFVFLTDADFPKASAELTSRVSEHLAEWMTRPPVVFFNANDSGFQARPVKLSQIAGSVPDEGRSVLQASIGQLIDVANDPDAWERICIKSR